MCLNRSKLQVVKKWILSITVEPVIFLYMMAVFLETSVTVDLVRTKVCLSLHSVDSPLQCLNKTVRKREDVSEETSEWIAYNNSLLSVISLISAFAYASWGDQFGRKFPILIPPVGSCLAASILIVLSFYESSHVSLLLIAYFVSGATGGISAIVANCFGFVNDATSEFNRTKRYAILEAFFFIGGTLGNYLGGFMLSVSNYAIAYTLELILLINVILYIVVRVPNRPHSDVQPEIRSRSVWHSLCNVRHVISVIETVFRARENGKRSRILLMMLASALTNCTTVVQIILLYNYLTDEPLGMDPSWFGYFNAINYSVEGICLLVVLPLVLHWVCIPDTVVAMIGVLSQMLGVAFLGFSHTRSMVFFSIPLFMFSQYCVAAIRSILSKLVESDEKGKILVFMAGIQSLCFVIGSLAFNRLYTTYKTVFRGLPFELVAGLQLIALAIFIYFHVTSRRMSEGYDGMIRDDLPERLEHVTDYQEEPSDA